jgi:TolB-like protein/Tfp pilus assembly protein PilF
MLVASKLSSFFGELKRRKVYRVAVVYIVVGLGILGAAEVILDPLGLEAARPFVVILTLLGLPIALVLAWAYEVKPEEAAAVGLPDGDGQTPSGLASQREVELASPVEVAEPEQRPSIAVLPFMDMSPGQDHEYFCEEIGRRLDVGAVLEGSVRRDEDKLRVTAQLLSVQDGYHLWSDTYDRELKDVFAIQDEISRSIVETVRPTLLGDAEAKLVEAPTRSLEAYDHYLRGRHYWEGRYEGGLETALRYFESAVEIDPEYALPYTGIADSYAILGIYGYIPPQEARRRTSSAAQRAVELDDGLSEAHASLAFYRMSFDWDWERGAVGLRKAIELNPANAKAHVWLAFLRGLQGRFEEAFDEMALAKNVDPLNNYNAAMTACVHTWARDFESGAGLFEEILRRDPHYLFAVWLLAMTYREMSRHDDAVRMCEQAVTLSNEALNFKASLGQAYGSAGFEDRARAILDDLHACEESRYVSPLWLSWVHLGLGEYDRAFDLLAQAVADGTPLAIMLHQDSVYDPLRSDPRFAELAMRVGSGVVASSYDLSRSE